MNKNILTLICPDWHASALVLDIESGQVAYANWRCLRMLEFHDLMRIDGGRLTFSSAEMNERFDSALETAVADSVEATTLIGDQGGDTPPYSVTIRNPQGIFREILEHHFDRAKRMVVIEFATSGMVPEQSALTALSHAFLLTSREAKLVELLLLGPSPERIAARDGKSTPGMKRQMKEILSKTRCSRPTDLVKLVMSLCPLELGVGN